MFNLSAGELVVLVLVTVVLLGLIFFGSSTLPELRAQVASRSSRGPRKIDAPESSWAWSEWLLVGGVLLLGSLSLALVAARR